MNNELTAAITCQEYKMVLLCSFPKVGIKISTHALTHSLSICLSHTLKKLVGQKACCVI
jgi:hypothetical protein